MADKIRWRTRVWICLTKPRSLPKVELSAEIVFDILELVVRVLLMVLSGGKSGSSSFGGKGGSSGGGGSSGNW